MNDDSARADDGAPVINLRWLVRLRWGAALGQASVILIARELFTLELPLAWLFALIAVEAVTNLACVELLRRRAVQEWTLASVMALDVLLLTGLLHFSGGSFNPFNFLYLVHIALAAVVLRPAYTWGLVALSLACFGSLFGGVLGLPVRDHVHHAEQMEMHLRGMWVAFAVAAAFIVYFVDRIRRALAARDGELARSRARVERSDRLASLGTLAAGAAHELATPLGTIAVAAGELDAALTRGDRASISEDVALIQDQVRRCRAILDQMAAGDAPGEAPELVTLASLAESVARTMRPVGSIELALDGAVATRAARLPRRAVEQALRALVKNACDASDGAPVTLSGGSDGESLWLEVRDQGRGMAPEVLARVGEPFFTTKETGTGMGLGLYLTNALAEQLGGRLDIESELGRGTSVRFVLPSRTA
ncbi:MAG: HAMP domain-containing histidine kinase [Deltaproteobacteria bacterium]|nr:HAMP domain-containing histidine kinase [Deltaproteobacteria bacterium]